MGNKKEKTAPDVSVGADTEQPTSKNTTSSISENDGNIKSFEELQREMQLRSDPSYLQTISMNLAKETELVFDYDNDGCVAVNQLKGLINYGPLESYVNRSVRLAVLSPRECAKDIWKHLNELNRHHATTLKQDKVFLPEYIGFHDVFKCGLDIPNGDDEEYKLDS